MLQQAEENSDKNNSGRRVGRMAEQAIIIKRADDDEHDGHHGGAWKVAYADFMTAMMAFFLLLWILAASDEEALRGLADYFTPSLSESGGRGQGVLAGQVLAEDGVFSGTDGSHTPEQLPSFGEENPLAVFDSRLRDVAEVAPPQPGQGGLDAAALGEGGMDATENVAERLLPPQDGVFDAVDEGEADAEIQQALAQLARADLSPEELELAEQTLAMLMLEEQALAEQTLDNLSSEERAEAEQALQEQALADQALADLALAEAERREQLGAVQDLIEQAIAADPELAELQDQIRFNLSNDGLEIQLVDSARRAMFALGSAELDARTRQVVRLVGRAIAGIEKPVAVYGHTDALSFGAGAVYTNWELSTDRANATRRALEAEGVTSERFARITGLADSDPLIPERPDAPENRRIGILLVYPAALNGQDAIIRRN
jgi:chemotaxis protein MotB